jgi:type II secretory pathway predicted ATPase ExeA
LLERLGPTVNSAFLTNSHFPDPAALLQVLMYELSLPYEDRSEQALRLALTDRLLTDFAAGRPTVVIVDEAQHLRPDVLEELRLLSNLESRSGKALQIVLVGQPGLLDLLAQPELAPLRQRLAIRAEVGPLPLQEAADYLLHHVRVSGERPEDVFSDEGLEVLARGTGGVPRLLNQAAHQALKLASEAGSSLVDVEAALEALVALGLESEEGGEPPAIGGVEDAGPMMSLAEENAEPESVLPLGEAVTPFQEEQENEERTFPRPA